MAFKHFAKKIREHLETMEGAWFVADTDHDEIWATYLGAFAPGTNEIFRERTEHDCSCCRQFIRAFGNVVQIKDGKVTTIWDVKTNKVYQPVADAMSTYVRNCVIRSKISFSCAA